jgi:hypothetical protein
VSKLATKKLNEAYELCSAIPDNTFHTENKRNIDVTKNLT